VFEAYSQGHRGQYIRVRPGASVQGGFTLVEISIVLVIIGLILGGVFKGQALIDSARVRSLSTEVSGIRTAWYSFQERYRSIPGDFSGAGTQIDSAALPGNGNGRIDDSQERAGVWQQLALAGFISGHFDGAQSAVGSATDLECSPGTCPRNPYNGFYKISYSAQAADTESPAHEIYTGNQIPVNILSQLDLKLDDGHANSGRFRVHRAYLGACTRNGEWDVPSAHANCAGVLRD
jgi:prepilin-type N-terminal cleavage/methylation domain-containing protein